MKRPRQLRRGSVVSEALAAVALATVTVTGIAQLVGVAARQWTGAQQRAVAVREAGNAMEQLLGRPWGELAAAKLPTVELPESTRRVLPDSQIQATVATDNAENDGLQIRIRLDWRNPAGQRALPMYLAAWRFRSGEAAP